MNAIATLPGGFSADLVRAHVAAPRAHAAAPRAPACADCTLCQARAAAHARPRWTFDGVLAVAGAVVATLAMLGGAGLL